MAESILVDCDAIDNFQNMDLHPLCEMFPQACDEDYDALVSSMKQRGFLGDQFVVVISKAAESEGDPGEDYLVLDGRNRLTAALDAGVTPVFKEYVGDDALGFVLARNLDRRHLSAGQKAALATKLSTMKVGENKNTAPESVSQEEAAKLVKSNLTNIAKFKRVQEADPELAAEVELGHVTLDAAYNKVSKPTPGEGKGQKPQEAAKRESSDPEEVDDTTAPAPPDLPGKPLPPTGSLDMSFEDKAKQPEKKFSTKVDRGPWEDTAEGRYHQSKPILLIGMSPQTIRLSLKEAQQLHKQLSVAISKLAS